jgi:hypothetical protein
MSLTPFIENDEVVKNCLIVPKAGLEPSRNGRNDSMWRQNGDIDS